MFKSTKLCHVTGDPFMSRNGSNHPMIQPSPSQIRFQNMQSALCAEGSAWGLSRKRPAVAGAANF